MLSIQDILAAKPSLPEPPVLVIDEKTIHETVDAGPICGCVEMFKAVNDYKPFIAGGYNPYRRRKIPNNDLIDVMWVTEKVGPNESGFEKPLAFFVCDKPASFKKPEDLNPPNYLLVKVPGYTRNYFEERQRRWDRQHLKDCKCPV